MAPADNIYANGYPTTSKYHMLPTHLRDEISTKEICFLYAYKKFQDLVYMKYSILVLK